MSVQELRPVPAQALTRRELAQHLGVSERTIRRWVQAGCPHEKWGPVIQRYDPVEVRRWLAQGGYGSAA